MSQTNALPSAQAEQSAHFLFALFIHVADADESLGARDVQTFQDLLEHPDWCASPLIRAGLDVLRARYGELWKDYQKKIIAREIKSIGDRLGALLSLGAQTDGLVTSALEFVRRLGRGTSPTLVRLGLVAGSAARQQACRELETLLTAASAGAIVAPAPAAVAATPVVAPAEPVSETDLSIWPAASLAFEADNVWKRGRTQVVCVAVIPETHDVKTFVFQAVHPRLFVYKPGQFATLELPIEGKTVRRSYTISSSPSRPHSLSITVKRVPGGLVSNWLHDTMQVGFQFALSGPHGEFTCFDAPAEKLLLISAGSGITPVMSMLRWLVDTQSPADVVFINNIRTPADVIFENELRYLGMRMGDRLKLAVIPGKVEMGQAWNGPVCFFSESVVRMWAPDYVEREVFVCGPPGYMDMVRGTLERMGHPPHRYHQESFGGAPAPAAKLAAAPPPPPVSAPVKKPATAQGPAPAAATVVASAAVEVVFVSSGKTIQVGPEDFLLDAAEANGIALNNSCRAGSCGTCKVKKTEGEVEMDGQQALSESDLEDGYVLACVGRACGKRVVLEA